MRRSLERLSVRHGYPVSIFGDRGYNHGHECLQVPHGGSVRTDAEIRFDRIMSKIRVPVEWSFGKVIGLFAFTDYKKNNKLYSQPIGSYWKNATLLANCHSCFYSNEISTYFEVPTPSIEDYLT